MTLCFHPLPRSIIEKYVEPCYNIFQGVITKGMRLVPSEEGLHPPTFKERGWCCMLTTESLISIISFAVAMFSFGYMFGSNSKNTKK